VELKAQSSNLVQKLIETTNDQPSTKATMTQNQCYLPRELEEESSAILVLRLSVLSIVVAFPLSVGACLSI